MEVSKPCLHILQTQVTFSKSYTNVCSDISRISKCQDTVLKVVAPTPDGGTSILVIGLVMRQN